MFIETNAPPPATAAAAVLSAVAHVAHATPVTFTNINVSGSNQSRIAIAATAMLLRAAQATVGSDVDHTEAVKLVERLNGVELS